jgi:hypothetical protein
MVKDIYQKTIQLEEMFQSSSIHILSRDFDPFNELLKTLNLPEEKNTLFLELVQLYMENQMTLNELLIAFEEHMKKLQMQE